MSGVGVVPLAAEWAEVDRGLRRETVDDATFAPQYRLSESKKKGGKAATFEVRWLVSAPAIGDGAGAREAVYLLLTLDAPAPRGNRKSATLVQLHHFYNYFSVHKHLRDSANAAQLRFAKGLAHRTLCFAVRALRRRYQLPGDAPIIVNAGGAAHHAAHDPRRLAAVYEGMGFTVDDPAELAEAVENRAA